MKARDSEISSIGIEILSTFRNWITKTKRKLYILAVFGFLAIPSLRLISADAQVQNLTVEDELPQIPITSTSWEEWFFMARLEIDGQPYMFIDNFARNQSGPNPVITQNGNIVYLSQGQITGQLEPPFVHSLIYPTYELPALRSGAPLIPSRPSDTYFIFTSVMEPPFWYEDGGTAYPSLTLNTDITGYQMICDVSGYYHGQPVTGVGSYDHVWINNFDWEGFYYENWLWFKTDLFAGLIVETKDNSGTHYWSDGGIDFFSSSGYERVTTFTITDIGDIYHYDVTIPTSQGTIHFQTTDPIYGSAYPISDHVVFTINGTFNGQSFTGYGGNEVRRGSPPHYDISGYVEESDGTPIEGVLMTLAGDASGSTNTNSSGYYEFLNLAGDKNYTVTPSKAGWSFDPPSIFYTPLNADQTGQNYTGTPTTTIITLSGPTQTEDCAIGNDVYSTLNAGGSTTDFAVGSYGTWGIKGRALVRWDLSSMPIGSTIISATMKMYCYQDDFSTSMTINTYRILKPWIEGTQQTEDRNLDTPPSCCWVEYGNNIPWDTPGADASTDRSLTAISSTTGAGIGWYSWDLTNAVQNWSDGSWSNEGVILISSDEATDDLKYFTPSESSLTSQRPRLVIEYSQGGSSSKGASSGLSAKPQTYMLK